MIDTNKLIPQRKEGARLSEKTITTIGFIKKDVVKIDSLLKERLVLSKVRYRILRQQNEREKRFGREKSLESKKSRPQDFGFNMLSNKKRKGLGGFLGGILKSILGVLGFSIFKSLPGLIRVGAMIKTIAVPFTALVGVAFLTLRTIVNVGRKISAETRGLDPKKINRDAVDKGINNFSTQLVRAAQAFAAGVAGGIIAQRLVKGRVVGIKEAEKIGAARIVARRKRIKKTGLPSNQEIIRSQGFDIDDIIRDEINIRPRKTGAPRSDLKTGSMVGDYEYDSRFTPDENIDRLIEFEKQKELRELSGKRGRPSKRITRLQDKSSTQLTLDTVKPIQKIKASNVESTIVESFKQLDISKQLVKGNVLQRTLFEESFINRALNQAKKDDLARLKDAELGNVKSALDDFPDDPRLAQAMADPDMAKIDAEMNAKTKSKKPPKSFKVSPRGRKIDPETGMFFAKRANKTVLAKRAAERAAKDRIAKLATKKGLSRLLFKFGGEALEQSVKQVVKQSVSTIPLIGDLIGFLLDVFLFKQPVGRAAFMAGGSVLGGMIGGILGLIGGPPGVLVGSIIGGIGGDLLGGAFYDLIVGKKSIGVVQQVGESAVKKTIKGAGLPGFTLGGFTGVTGGYTHPMEFVIDRNSTLELERNAPGFLSALNKASGSGVIDVLRSYTSYESTDTGTETFIPLPFEKIVTRTITVGGESRDTDDSTSPFIDLYRRG